MQKTRQTQSVWLSGYLRGAGHETSAASRNEQEGPAQEPDEGDDSYVSPDDSFANAQSWSGEWQDAVPPDVERPEEVRADLSMDSMMFCSLEDIA